MLFVALRRGSRGWWILAAALALVAGVFGFYARTRPVSGRRPGTNVVQQAASATLTNAAISRTAAPPPTSPDVGELLALMQRWRMEHPYYHVLVETSGADVSSTAEVYSFVDPQGRPETRIKSQLLKPNTLSFIAEAQTNRVLAYFPKSNQVVEMINSASARKLLIQLGWTGKTEFDPILIFKLAQVSFVESGDDFKALTLVFPPAAFQLPPAAGELFWTIKLDAYGKVLGLEQLTLGNRVVSKLTYYEEDLATIQRRAPRIPSTAVRVDKAFTDVMKEEVNLINSKAPVAI